jgi:hypothetical protein
MTTMVVQIITVFHIRWIDYYYLVGETNIYNTDVKGRKTKDFHLYETSSFNSYWKYNMKESPYRWIFESFDFILIDTCEIFP